MKTDPEIDYAQANLFGETRILGVRLLAFKAGHKLILQAFESPFFAGGRDPEPKDLIVALWICSLDYRTLRRAKRMSLLWKLRTFRLAWKLNRDAILFYRAIEAFFDYLNVAHAKPKGVRKKRRDGEEEPEVTCAPSLMVLKRDLGLTPEVFFEMPMRAAIGDRYGTIERDGTVEWPAAWELGRMSKRPDTEASPAQEIPAA